MTKGIIRKICGLCVCVLINKCCFEPFMRLDPVCKDSQGFYSFCSSGPQVLNELPYSVRHAATLSSFKMSPTATFSHSCLVCLTGHPEITVLVLTGHKTPIYLLVLHFVIMTCSLQSSPTPLSDTACVRACVRVCVRACMHVCICAYVHVCVNACIYM